MSKRAVIYGRVSRDDREKDSRNIDGQIDMGREYALKHGYTIAEELKESDKGASGAEINLPQLNKIRAMARAGEFDVLVVREIDRLSRNLAKQLIVEEELKRAAVTIDYVLGEYPDTPEGNFMKHVRASVAEFEREKIKERMERGTELKIKAGSVMVRHTPPYGYRVVEVGNIYCLEVYEPEARIVRLIFAWYIGADGERQAMTAIAKRLTKLGVPTAGEAVGENVARPGGLRRSMPAGHWRHAIIGNILKNKTYMGVWTWGKQRLNAHKQRITTEAGRIDVAVPALVDPGTFEAAQRVRGDNKHLRGEAKYEYLLSGRLTGPCEYHLSACSRVIGGKVYRYYRCGGRRGAADPCDCPPAYPADLIDHTVWNWVLGFMRNPAELAEAIDAAQNTAETKISPLRAELETAEGLLAENEAQAKRLMDACQAGVYKLEDIAGRKRALDDKALSLNRRRAELLELISKSVISEARVARLLEFARRHQENIDLAIEDFNVRKGLMETLDVRAVVRKVGKQALITATCVLKEEGEELVATSSIASVSISLKRAEWG